MRVKHTYSRGLVWKPDAEGSTTKQLATSGVEISFAKLSSGGGSAAMALYDATTAGNANYSNLAIFLDCSTTDNDTCPFPAPVSFKNGIYAVLEQGTGYNPVLTLTRIPPEA